MRTIGTALETDQDYRVIRIDTYSLETSEGDDDDPIISVFRGQAGKR